MEAGHGLGHVGVLRGSCAVAGVVVDGEGVEEGGVRCEGFVGRELRKVEAADENVRAVPVGDVEDALVRTAGKEDAASGFLD